MGSHSSGPLVPACVWQCMLGLLQLSDVYWYCNICPYVLLVATTLLVVQLTSRANMPFRMMHRSYYHLVDTLAHFDCIQQLMLIATLILNWRWLANSSLQLMHTLDDITCCQWSQSEQESTTASGRYEIFTNHHHCDVQHNFSTLVSKSWQCS